MNIEEYLIALDDSDFLEHYGILGMKWGVRRYQNKDGSLTEAGKKRYYDPKTGRLTKEGEKQYNAVYGHRVRGKVFKKHAEKKHQRLEEDRKILDENSPFNSEKRMPKKVRSKAVKELSEAYREYAKLYPRYNDLYYSKEGTKERKEFEALSKKMKAAGDRYTALMDKYILKYPATAFVTHYSAKQDKKTKEWIADLSESRVEVYSKPVKRDAQGIAKLPGSDYRDLWYIDNWERGYTDPDWYRSRHYS